MIRKIRRQNDFFLFYFWNWWKSGWWHSSGETNTELLDASWEFPCRLGFLGHVHRQHQHGGCWLSFFIQHFLALFCFIMTWPTTSAYIQVRKTAIQKIAIALLFFILSAGYVNENPDQAILIEEKKTCPFCKNKEETFSNELFQVVFLFNAEQPTEANLLLLSSL